MFLAITFSFVFIHDSNVSRRASRYINSLQVYEVKFRDFSQQYSYVVEPSKTCTNRTKLLILVLSFDSKFEQREVIRQTYANSNFSKGIQNGSVIVNFLMSSVRDKYSDLIDQESKQFGDLIITNLPESYDKLYLKVYSLLQFHNNKCSHVDYVIKIDDDVALIIDRLTLLMEKEKKFLFSTDSISCHVWDKALPKRDPKHKWYLSYKDYPNKYFPRYCDGPIYMIGKDAVPKMLAEARNQKWFRWEDVLFTGIITKAAGIKLFQWKKHVFFRPEMLNGGKTTCHSGPDGDTFGAYSFGSSSELKRAVSDLLTLKCPAA